MMLRVIQEKRLLHGCISRLEKLIQLNEGHNELHGCISRLEIVHSFRNSIKQLHGCISRLEMPGE